MLRFVFASASLYCLAVNLVIVETVPAVISTDPALAVIRAGIVAVVGIVAWCYACWAVKGRAYLPGLDG